MCKCLLETGPAIIDHLSAKNVDFLDLFYHNSKTIYVNTTKSSSLLQNLVGFLLQLTEMRYIFGRKDNSENTYNFILSQDKVYFRPHELFLLSCRITWKEQHLKEINSGVLNSIQMAIWTKPHILYES